MSHNPDAFDNASDGLKLLLTLKCNQLQKLTMTKYVGVSGSLCIKRFIQSEKSQLMLTGMHL